jgi:hypothetical protein
LTQALKRSAGAAVLAGAILVALGGLPAQASAAGAPCWKRLITDWYDGTINKTYPIPCYQQAVNHLPTDAQLYSNAKEDILRAMSRAIAAQNAAKRAAAATTTHATTTQPATTHATTTHPAATPPPPTTTPTTTKAEAPPPPPTTTAPPPTTTPTTTKAAVVPPATTSPGRVKPKGVARALDKLNPGDASSFPLPLLILGIVAILLVAAGVAGMIWRRMDRGGGTDAGPA